MIIHIGIKDTNYFKIISIICSSIIPLLVVGPFFPDLIISSLSIWFLFYTYKNKIYYVYKNKFFIIFILFCLTCIASSIFSDSILFSLKSSLFYIRIGIFSLLVSFLIDRHKNILKYFYYSFLFTFSILIIDGYFQYFNGINLIGLELRAERVSSFFGEELILGSFLARLFPLFFAIFVIRKNKSLFEVAIVSIIFILIDVLIFIAGERTAFFLLNLSTIFIIIFISKYKFLRLVIFSFSALIIFFIMSNNDNFYKRYVEGPIESIGIYEEKKFFFTPAHDALLNTAWKMFLDKPLLGHGPKLFRIKCKEEKYLNYNETCNSSS